MRDRVRPADRSRTEAAPADPAPGRDGAAERILLLFLDGVGIGPVDPAVNAWFAARLPTFDAVFGARPSSAQPCVDGTNGRAAVRPLDACLGTDGLPQSGTGQASLLTGRNAARDFGRHFGPWTPVALRPVVAEDNLLSVAARAGRTVAFANAYPEELIAAVGSARPPAPLRAATVIAALGAGVLTRHTPDLAAGRAVASEITNRGWREHLGREEVPDIDAPTAGTRLAAIVREADLTLYAHYATDTAGHARDLESAVAALERVDGLLHGLLPAIQDDTLVVIASDHGNIEDARAGHTRNPALGAAVGPGAAEFLHPLRSISEVAPAILAALGVR